MTKSLHCLLVALLMVLWSGSSLMAQPGGNYTYSFLNLTNSARVAALGTNFMAVQDNDVSVGAINPSVISPQMSGQLALNYTSYYAGINYGYASYGHTFQKAGSFVGTVQYMNYGNFTYADAGGNTGGEFSANDMAVNVGWGRSLDSNFRIGANFRVIYSALEGYTSVGLGVDVAGTYVSNSGYVTSLILRNIGRQVKHYSASNNEALPFEIQLGMSKRLEHVPFRYSIVLTNLQKWDLSYDDPTDPDNQIDPLTGKKPSRSSSGEILDQAMRHVVIGGEFVPTKSFRISVGYNYQRRQEMKVDTKTSTVGFSWGFGLRIKKLDISYARSAYHLVGSPNYISISTSLTDLFSH